MNKIIVRSLLWGVKKIIFRLPCEYPRQSRSIFRKYFHSPDRSFRYFGGSIFPEQQAYRSKYLQRAGVQEDKLSR